MPDCLEREKDRQTDRGKESEKGKRQSLS
ncbi:hypothetical protein R3I94_012562 [Phoxinus phoxinus]|uniref:Uncharacterized protein n=1 Tax=Phoxinus phoxinus TaxID=58324 RepID=A0AAN9CUR1_9TELE